MEPNEYLVSPHRATRTKELGACKSDNGELGSDDECKGKKEKIAQRPADKDQLQVMPANLGTNVLQSNNYRNKQCLRDKDNNPDVCPQHGRIAEA